MRKIILVAIGLAAIAAAWLLRPPLINFPPPEPPSQIIVHSEGPTVERLQKLSHLVVTRVLVADVLTGEGEGHVGVWLVKGDALLGVDLSRAKIIARDDEANRATIQLPPPQLLQSRVDHEHGTRIWELRKTGWWPWSGDGGKLLDHVMREAQKLVAQAASSPEYVAQSKTAAAAIISTFYEESIGWHVTVTWADAADESEKTVKSTQ